MDKKSIAILLVASSFASSAFATNIINKLITKHSSITPSISKTVKTTDRPYIDFSGTWIGNCGDGTSISTVIDNDATYISLDDNEWIIGKGLQGEYKSNDQDTGYNHTSFEWNKDGSALIMKSVDVTKTNVDNSVIQTDMSTFAFTMKNGQLNWDGTITWYEDLTQIQDPVNIHCVFSKKK